MIKNAIQSWDGHSAAEKEEYIKRKIGELEEQVSGVPAAIEAAETAVESAAAAAIAAAAAAASSKGKYKKVETLPEASEETVGYIYMSPSETEGVYNLSYTEQNGDTYSWVSCGNTELDLTGYATTDELSQLGQKLVTKNYISDTFTTTVGIESGHLGYFVTPKIAGAEGEIVYLGNLVNNRYTLAYNAQGDVIAYRSNAYASYKLPADTAAFVVCFGPSAIDHKVYKNGIVVWEKTDSPSDLIGLQQEIDGEQKAISENNALASSAFEQLFSKEPVPFLGMLDYNIQSNGTFGTSTGYKHSRMKVLPGDVIEFDSPDMTRPRTLFVCFLSTYDYTPTSGGTIPILNGTTPMIYHNVGAAGQEIVTGRKIVIPADCYAIAFDIYSNADPVVNIQREKLNDVVSHYRSYIQERAFDIRKKDINLGQNADSFLFFTDFHIQETPIVNSVSNFGHSPALVKYLQEHTNTKKIFFGGDVFGSPDGDVKRYELMDKFLNLFSFAQPMFSTIGNHEWRQSTGNDGRTRDFGSLAKTLEGVVTFGRDASGNITQPYYYFDNPSLKIRYFVLYTPGPDSGTSYAVFDYNAQLAFVENEIAELDNSWRVVVVQHIIYDNASGSTYDAEGYPTNLHTTGVGASLKTFVRNHNDTSDVKIIAIVCGHAHNDFCEFVDGNCVALCNDCDATFTRFNGVNDTIFPNQSVRNWGTITEQCFDVYHIDIKDKIVYGTRIGYGFDKVVNITEQSVSVGDTIPLSPSITPDSWVSQDESIATVANGAVTGVSAGRVTIKAREAGSPNGKWEYFNIIVS